MALGHLKWNLAEREATVVERALAILAKIPQVRWFAAAGRDANDESERDAAGSYAAACGGGLPVRWLASWDEARQVVRGLDDESSFWRQEEAWRRQATHAAESAGRGDALAGALHRLSVAGYAAVRPAVADEELARVASGAALWTAAAAIAWAAAEDLLAPRPNPFLPKLTLFERGHWPLGKWERSIVVL